MLQKINCDNAVELLIAEIQRLAVRIFNAFADKFPRDAQVFLICVHARPRPAPLPQVIAQDAFIAADFEAGFARHRFEKRVNRADFFLFFQGFFRNA